jgi:very-short-patch-repair endonuclease
MTTKHPILAIEVDGMAFHQADSEQANRDKLKNSILDKAGIPLLRLSTDGSNEKNKIINALNI